jgi:ketosteroid isomerase-like protein
MPIVESRALSLSVSSPSSCGKKTLEGFDIPGLVVPIELENGCHEAGIVINSDNVAITNAIRKHFLEHFGHRDLAGLVSDYDPNAIMMQVTATGERTKFHGHEEIRNYFQNVMFQAHPAGASSFQLESIKVEQKHATVVWSAKTPTLVIDQGTDTLVFNAEGKIMKEYFICETHEREDPGTSRVVRKDDKEYEEFFC